MKIQVLIPLRGIAFAGVLSCAVICPVYGQEVRVRQIGQPSPGISSDTVTRAATAEGNATRIQTRFVTLDLNGFLWKLEVPV
jgi:hypothetical protein